MTFERRVLGPGEVDHEVLWSGVIVACGILGWSFLHAFGLPPLVCPFKAATGIPCLTCGTGRALALLANGDVTAALRSNPLVPLGVTGAVVYVMYAAAAMMSRGGRLRLRVTEGEGRVLRWLFLAAGAALWGWLVADGR